MKILIMENKIDIEYCFVLEVYTSMASICNKIL